MAGDTSCLSLYRLSTAKLQPIGRHEGVKGHILRLEWSWMIAVLLKNPTKTSRQDALSHVTPRANEHQRSQVSSRHLIHYSQR